MCEDFIGLYQVADDQAYNTCLHQIQRILVENGCSCINIGLPEPTGAYEELACQLDAHNAAKDVGPPQIHLLTDEQREIFDRIYNAVKTTSGIF